MRPTSSQSTIWVLDRDLELPAFAAGTHLLRTPGPYVPDPRLAYKMRRNWDTTLGVGAPIFWPSIEPDKGRYEFSKLLQFMNYEHNRGGEVVLQLIYTPSWAADGDPDGIAPYPAAPKGNKPLRNLQDLADFLTATHAALVANGTPARFWELRNEISGPKFWRGTPAQAAAEWRVAYSTLKALDPTIQVLSSPCTNIYGGAAYFASVLAADDGAGGVGARHFDIAAYHPYVNDHSSRIARLVQVTAELRAALAKAGRGGVDLWATEYGIEAPHLASLPDARQVELFEAHTLALIVLGYAVRIWYAHGHFDGMEYTAAGAVDSWNALAELSGDTVLAGSRIVMDGQSTCHIEARMRRAGVVRRVVRGIV